jgi:uracil-DNA glycosylase family 4
METLDALRSYVRFLHETEGLRDVRLSPAAVRGLALIGGRGAPGSLRSPTEGGRASGSRPSPGSPVARGTDTTSNSLPSRIAVPVVSKTSAPRIEEVITVAGATKAEQLAHLGERAANCQKCAHLAARRTHVVFGVGNPEARIMFVGEAPGEEEDLQGEPFVGRAGQLLTKMITAMGLARNDVYIANILKCRPDMPLGSSGNRKPTGPEMDTCLPYLRAQIDVIQPAVMIALGATALEGLLGPVGGISKLRGTFLEYRGIPLMPTFHPSYLLRNASNTEKRKVWEDLLQVMERTGMPVSDKQRGFFLAK